jgi:membrane-bound metal-dependent hydrolase YbcI (DUF457 family)
MPSTVVHAAVGFTIAAGLLGAYYDRRALGVVLLALLIPETDTMAGWVLDGAHRALLHNLVFTAVAVALLYWETTRNDSWLRDRFGARGVRVAWVALFVHTFAHLAFDWAHLDGINLLYPLHDRFFELSGEAYLSNTDGFVQTFVEVVQDPETGGRSVDAGQGGTTEDTHVASPAQPSREPEPGPVDRRFPVAVQGWQLYLVCLGAFTLVAKHLQSAPPEGREDA